MKHFGSTQTHISSLLSGENITPPPPCIKKIYEPYEAPAPGLDGVNGFPAFCAVVLRRTVLLRSPREPHCVVSQSGCVSAWLLGLSLWRNSGEG